MVGNDPGLRRSREDQWIAGVCAGIAKQIDQPPNLVRLLYVVVSILSTAFPGTLFYLLLWFVIPEDDSETREDEPAYDESAYDGVESSHLSRSVAFILAGLLGIFGAHRFYAGRYLTGMVMLLTLGGALIWWMVDMMLIAVGEFRDSEGYRLIHWESAEPARDAFLTVHPERREATNPYPTDTGSV